MSWTDVYPVFTEDQVDEFLAEATPEERAQLEEWYGVERVLNARPECPEIVSVSLFWKPVHSGSPELPEPTRERLQAAVDLGLADRYSPWDHYVQPLLELVPELSEKFPETVIRVHLAKDLEFLAEELVAAGCEVWLMRHSSLNFAPGGLWRFLPFAEKDKLVVVTDIDRLNDLESDLTRTRTMKQSGVGAWRVPNPSDLSQSFLVSYLPFIGCQFGVQGGLLEDVLLLLHAFTWQAWRERLDPNVIMPSCGPTPIGNHTWPSYGFDEYFLNVAVYPRLAQEGMLTFVPTGAKSLLLSLDVEYCTWGNPNSELVYFASGSCCGVNPKEIPNAEKGAHGDAVLEGEALLEAEEQERLAEPMASHPKVGFLFLTRGDHHQSEVWREYLEEVGEAGEVFCHVDEPEEVARDSPLQGRVIKTRMETAWADISIVRVTLALLEEALANEELTHFMVLSESCVPVRPFAELLRSLRHDPRTRMKFEPWSEMRRTDILKAQRVQKLKTIRKELAHFQHHWMILNRADAQAILKKDHTEDFESCFSPDECYFATSLAVAGLAPRTHIANRMVTWVNWDEGGASPKTFEKVHPQMVARIAESGCFFARKFSAGSNIGSYRLHLPLRLPSGGEG